MDPVTGKCVWTDEQMRIPVTKLQHYIDAAQKGTFIPDKEKDELTMALGNPEHPVQTRGTPGSIPWKVGFWTQAVTNARRGGKKCSRPKCRRCKQG